MDDLDLSDMLAGGSVAAGADVLSGIVRRHGRLRARRARIAATTVVILALGGAGLGIGLSGRHDHLTTALGGSASAGSASAGGGERAPAGLTWASASHSAAGTAGPGVFGWLVAPYPAASADAGPDQGAGHVESTVVPPAVGTSGFGADVPSVCGNRGCGVLYSGESIEHLFRRIAGGVTIDAGLADFDLATGTRPPVLSLPPASHAGSVSAGSAAHASRPVTSRATRVVLPCVSRQELLVTVAQGASKATLAVPGAASGPLFSVVASAGADLGGRRVVLVVTYTSLRVSRVTAWLPGGGEDDMTPVDGWSVLVLAPARGTSLSAAGEVRVVATSAAGATVATVKLPATGALAMPAPTSATCHYWIAPGTTVTSPPPASAGSPPASAKSG